MPLLTSWKNTLPANWRSRLSAWRQLANRHPKRSVAVLLSALLLQTALAFLWHPASPQAASEYHRLGAALPSPPSGDRPLMPSIPFTLGNYREVRALLDTLEYLRARPNHSRADTLLFLRVLERYARLDTAFARSLQPAVPGDRHPSNPTTHRP